MKAKYSLALILLCLLLLISPCFADWTIISQTGDWNSVSLASFADNGNREGRIDFQDTFENFTGFEYQISFNTLYCRRLEWWHESAEKTVKVWFNITDDNGNNFWACIQFWDFQRGWGSSYGRKTGADAAINHTEGFAGFGFYPIFNYDLTSDHVEFDLYFNRTSNKIYAVFYLFKADQPKPYLMNFCGAGSTYDEGNAIIIDPNDFVNVTITVTYWHGGSGYFDGGASLDIHTNDSFYLGIYEHPIGIETDIWSFIGALEHALGSVLPSFLSDFVKMFGGWFKWLSDIVIIFFLSASMIFPFLPFIFIAYLCDAIFASINHGEIRPVGDFVMTIYGLLVAIIGTIVNIAGTIYDFIHFW
jgi:hypothetical protein